MKEKLKKCPVCNDLPTAFSRWENNDCLYSWYQCNLIPPCSVGTCHKPDEKNQETKMIRGWNRSLKKV